MSNIYSVSSAAIPIKKQHNYGYSISQKHPTKYLFELHIGLNDGSYQSFSKIDENRYTDLININDNISYENIQSYSINISLIPESLDETFTNTGYLKNFMNFFSNQDNNIYIEFNKLNNGNTSCSCRYIDYNKLSVSISPPI